MCLWEGELTSSGPTERTQAPASKGEREEFFISLPILACVWLRVEGVNASYLEMIGITGQSWKRSGQQHLQLTLSQGLGPLPPTGIPHGHPVLVEFPLQHKNVWHSFLRFMG